MSDWLDEHLETFVKPHLGTIPDPATEGQGCGGSEYGYPAVLTSELLQDLKTLWVRGKALSKGKPILFPGRDAWLLHVLANMEGYPTLFHPELSRSVAMSGLVDPTPFAGCFIIDCGANGTIPEALRIADFALTNGHGIHKLQPGDEDSRSAYAFMMYHAKYWNHADPVGGVVVQTLADTDEFTRCCQLTQYFVEVACQPRKKTMVLITPQETP